MLFRYCPRLLSGNKNVNSPYSGHVTTLSDSSTVVHQSIHPRVSRADDGKKVALRSFGFTHGTIRGRDVSVFIVTDGHHNFNWRILLLLQLSANRLPHMRKCYSIYDSLSSAITYIAMIVANRIYPLINEVVILPSERLRYFSCDIT